MINKFDSISVLATAINEISYARQGDTSRLTTTFITEFSKAMALVALSAREEAYSPNWGLHRPLPPVLRLVRDTIGIQSPNNDALVFKKLKQTGQHMSRIEAAANSFQGSLLIWRHIVLSQGTSRELIRAILGPAHTFHDIMVVLKAIAEGSDLVSGSGGDAVSGLSKVSVSITDSVFLVKSVLHDCFQPEEPNNPAKFNPVLYSVRGYSSKYDYIKKELMPLVHASRRTSPSPLPALLSKNYLEKVLANPYIPGDL